MREAKFNEDGAYSAALEACATPSRVLDDLEPETCPDQFRAGFREAASRALYVMNCGLSWILDARQPRIAATQVAIALGSSVTGGLPMERLASGLGCTRAALSKGARSFARSAGILPVGSLKLKTDSYRDARLKSISRANVAHLKNTTTKEKKR